MYDIIRIYLVLTFCRPQTAPMGSGTGSGLFGRNKNKITPVSTGRNTPQAEETNGKYSLIFFVFNTAKKSMYML